MATTGSKRIAERYVKALFDVAGAGKALPQVEKDLNALAAAIEASEDLRAFIGNPLLGRDQQATAMQAVLERLKANKLTIDFIGALARAKRLPLLPEIAALFTQWAENTRGEITAEVVVASPLSDKDAASLADRLSKAAGKKINLQLRQDPSLLGGMIVKIGSQQLDSSLAGKLDRLKLALKAA